MPFLCRSCYNWCLCSVLLLRVVMTSLYCGGGCCSCYNCCLRSLLLLLRVVMTCCGGRQCRCRRQSSGWPKSRRTSPRVSPDVPGSSVSFAGSHLQALGSYQLHIYAICRLVGSYQLQAGRMVPVGSYQLHSDRILSTLFWYM